MLLGASPPQEIARNEKSLTYMCVRLITSRRDESLGLVPTGDGKASRVTGRAYNDRLHQRWIC